MCMCMCLELYVYIYIVITAYMLITTVGCIKLLNSDFFSDFWSSVLF